MPALAVVLALAGCVNREPEERAAFIAYLEQVAAPQAGVVAAPPDPPTRKALGDAFGRRDRRTPGRLGQAGRAPGGRAHRART
ncbi:DUF3053 domain-containing protein, partial [Bordetella pertussis]|uniref:DUF3053 domain-containing protein n=1 Tax=Bordetella pertussis TaxID=520 RepID=UPI0021CAECE1